MKSPGDVAGEGPRAALVVRAGIGAGARAVPDDRGPPAGRLSCRRADARAGRRDDGARRSAGFTLVEMLVTLAILGLATTVAVRLAGGAGSGRQAAQLSAALGAEIGLLRAQAIRSGQTTRLVFDPESGRFLSSRAGAAPIPTVPLPVVVEVGHSAGAPGEIRFLMDGSSSGGRIAIGPPRAHLALTVSALTAQVRQEGAR